MITNEKRRGISTDTTGSHDDSGPDSSSAPRPEPRGGASGGTPILVEQARAWLAAIIESSDDAIVSKTLDGIITSWNLGARRIFGYEAEEIVGQPITLLLPPDRQDEEVVILEWLRRGERVDHFESVRLAKDGRPIDVSLTISPIRDESGRIVGASKIARDITERRLAERALREAKTAAEAASRAKDHFLAVLSHELRTPLTPVLAAVTALEGHPELPADLREEVGLIRRNVEVEARLIDDLLDLTRLVRGKVELHREAVDVHSALHDALGFCRVDAKAKRLAVALDLRAGRHFVWADPARLRQILWNLIGNAVKYTPQGGRITLGTANDEHGRLEIRVVDTGVGIELGAQSRIFDAFEQGERMLIRGHGGLGLGLAISKALAELHGGRLEASSAGPGRGATFTLRLESIPTPEAVPPSEPDREGDTAMRGLRILLVEDHDDTRWVVTRLLRRIGHEVRTAGGVREALETAETEEFDLLISDLGLPDGTGLDVMRHLQGRPGLRGIALSGFGREEDRRRSRDAGFARHLTKPVDFRDLEGAIRQVTS
jgi:PAS domain S-box-containing protein